MRQVDVIQPPNKWLLESFKRGVMKHFITILGFSVFLLTSNISNAAYTANIKGKLLYVKIYNNNIIYFQIENQPTGLCSSNVFVINPYITESQLNRYYTMLMTAKAQNKAVSVGYDRNPGDCIGGRSEVHAPQLAD